MPIGFGMGGPTGMLHRFTKVNETDQALTTVSTVLSCGKNQIYISQYITTS